LGGSEYIKVMHGLVAGKPPVLDLELEGSVQNAVREAVRAGLLSSAHDCSEGGVAVALAESCILGKASENGYASNPPVGADVHIRPSSNEDPAASRTTSLSPGIGATVALDDDLPAVASLFSETQSRILVSCSPTNTEALLDLLQQHDVPWSVIGETGGDSLIIEDKVALPLASMAAAYDDTLEQLVSGV
jgi:phosphoribosylformylglycinamidine synthase